MSAIIHQTVKDLALRIPGATRLFEGAGIDYCCGGARTLEDACVIAGIDTSEMIEAVYELEQGRTGASEQDFGEMPLEDLVDHIVRTHHIFTINELDRLDKLLAKVRAKHERTHPELADVVYAFNRLQFDLLPHMLKEERVLFPYIKALERARREGNALARPPFVTVENPIRMMLQEHEMAGDFLREIRAATANFEIPDGVCMTFRALYEGLEGLEHDLHQHIHLENNILFPRAAELEAAAR
jgi:regulator of cell morphogenesis and NO signaling